MVIILAAVSKTKQIDGKIWELEGTALSRDDAQGKAAKIRRTYKNARVLKIHPTLWAIYSTVSVDKMVSRGKYW